jgi:tetratricopeptide (TPR) repeat protein
MERQFADALKQFQDTLSIREKLAAKFPDHSARQRELAAVHAHIGDALKDQNEAQKALAEYRKGLAIIQGFLDRHPNDKAADRLRQEIEAKIRALPPMAQ